MCAALGELWPCWALTVALLSFDRSAHKQTWWTWTSARTMGLYPIRVYYWSFEPDRSKLHDTRRLHAIPQESWKEMSMKALKTCNKHTRRPRPKRHMRRRGYHKSQIHVLVSWEMHCLLGSVDSSTKFVGCSPQRDYPAKASENRRLERANGRSPDREQNTYEQGTSSRANDWLNIWHFCLRHWVFARAVAIEANGCFKQTTELHSMSQFPNLAVLTVWLSMSDFP